MFERLVILNPLNLAVGVVVEPVALIWWQFVGRRVCPGEEKTVLVFLVTLSLSEILLWILVNFVKEECCGQVFGMTCSLVLRMAGLVLALSLA